MRILIIIVYMNILQTIQPCRKTSQYRGDVSVAKLQTHPAPHSQVEQISPSVTAQMM